jgi:hypothetical protein
MRTEQRATTRDPSPIKTHRDANLDISKTFTECVKPRTHLTQSNVCQVVDCMLPANEVSSVDCRMQEKRVKVINGLQDANGASIRM